jgi:non-heme chloroperoxidase
MTDAPAHRSSLALATSTIVTSDGTGLYYKDWGQGRPLVFLAGLGVPSDMWDYQMVGLSCRGFRCVAYDRRGHGRSTAPDRGYDYDTLADDLSAVLAGLELRDAVLVGHSMAAGELVRYVTRHGTARVGKLVFVSPMPLPYATRTADNDDGITAEQRSAFLQGVVLRDYQKWLMENQAPFFTPETSALTQDWLVQMMLRTSLKAVYECNRLAGTTDFRPELEQLRLPTLIIHGDKDVSAPLARAQRTAKMIRDARLKVYEGAPHGLFVTHLERLNADLEEFART